MTIHVSLPEELEWMVHSQVHSGFYKSASEVVREALRDFFSAKATFSPEQLAWLKEEMLPRLESVQKGTAVLLDADDVFKEILEGLH
jgi:antitoxin ParD1/3/4